MNCAYCYVRKDNANQSLSLEECLKVTDDFYGSGGKEKTIQFLGGEPLLEYKKIKAIMNHAANKYPDFKKSFILSTNGTLLDREKADFFNKHKVLIIASLDGSKKTHDFYRKFKNAPLSSYDVILNNFRRLDLNKTRLMISYVYTDKTIDCVLGNIKRLANEGFKMIDFQADVNALIGGDYEKKLRLLMDGFVDYYLGIFRDENEKKLFFVPAIKSLAQRQFRFSGSRCDSILLAPDKKYYSCGRLLGLDKKQRESYSFGSVKSGIDFKKRMFLLAEARDGINKKLKKCRKCDFFPYCLCKIAAYLYAKARKEDVFFALESVCLYSKIVNGAMLRIGKTLLGENNRRFKNMYHL